MMFIQCLRINNIDIICKATIILLNLWKKITIMTLLMKSGLLEKKIIFESYNMASSETLRNNANILGK